MSITNQPENGKIRIIPEDILGIGNIIPHQWYHIITTRTLTASGKTRPDNNAISVLSEIVYWYRPKVIRSKETKEKQIISKFSGEVWQTSYEHFTNKFNFNKQRTRRAITRLEELNLVKREFRTIYINGCKYTNLLFIHLNVEQLKRYIANHINTTSNKVLSPTPKISNPFLNTTNQLESELNLNITASKADYNAENNVLPYLQNEDIYKINKEEKELKNKIDLDRGKVQKLEFTKSQFVKSQFAKSESEESKFLKFKEKGISDLDLGIKANVHAYAAVEETSSPDFTSPKIDATVTTTFKQSSLKRTAPKKTSVEQKVLKQDFPGQKACDYSAFSEEELQYISSNSGREYSLQAIKKIREKINWKISKVFPSRNHLIRYCIKFVAKEITSEFELNKLNYNFVRNDEIGKKTRLEESYLQKIEESKDITLIGQLKRKIAGSFDRSLAYQLLQSARFIALKDETFSEANFIVKLPENIHLTEKQQELLENAIRSVYGDKLITYQYIADKSVSDKSGTDKSVTDLHVISQEFNLFETKHNLKNYSLWEKIRLELISYFGEERGGFLDKTWFSKFEAEEDRENKKLVLKAPSNFFRDYVQNGFGHLIEKICKTLDLGFDRFNSIITDSKSYSLKEAL